MAVRGQSIVDDLSPPETFAALKAAPSAALVDVRTRAEWSYVGLPDIAETGKALWLVEWVSFPGMAPNPRFLEDLIDLADGTLPDRLFYICRSGVRSMAAAKLVAAEMEGRGQALHCTNVAEGFEGELDPGRHRSKANGWKVHGLPWSQT